MEYIATDIFKIGGKELTSRLLIGTGKYSSHDIVPEVLEASTYDPVRLILTKYTRH